MSGMATTEPTVDLSRYSAEEREIIAQTQKSCPDFRLTEGWIDLVLWQARQVGCL
jgi:hypothetical protein